MAQPDAKPILVIEDDRDIRDSIQEFLELEGFQVYPAENGKEGLDTLKRIGEPCLILLDLFMPVMDGEEFLKELAGEGVDRVLTIPVVLISAAPERSEKVQSARTMVKKFIKKPVDLEAFLQMVKEAGCKPNAA